VVLEVAILDVKKGKEKEFEVAFWKAQDIISSMNGYVSHQLQKCVENTSRYILLVSWQTLEDHTVGFRESKEYQEWWSLLHHYYEPFPKVEHFQSVYSNVQDSQQ
jgi:heme-degrading monooxygenase HmoA